MRKIVALIALLLAGAPPALPAIAAERPSAGPTAGTLSPDQLFSRRALRRARLIIQMRMLQLHDERLECVRAALLRSLPGALLPEPPSVKGQASGRRQFATICDFFPLPG